MAVAVAVAVTVAVAVAVAVAVLGLTKKLFNHIQKDFLINVWGYYYIDVPVQKISAGISTKRAGSIQPKWGFTKTEFGIFRHLLTRHL